MQWGKNCQLTYCYTLLLVLYKLPKVILKDLFTVWCELLCCKVYFWGQTNWYFDHKQSHLVEGPPRVFSWYYLQVSQLLKHYILNLYWQIKGKLNCEKTVLMEIDEDCEKLYYSVLFCRRPMSSGLLEHVREIILGSHVLWHAFMLHISNEAVVRLTWINYLLYWDYLSSLVFYNYNP